MPSALRLEIQGGQGEARTPVPQAFQLVTGREKQLFRIGDEALQLIAACSISSVKADFLNRKPIRLPWCSYRRDARRAGCAAVIREN
jgi:hypothetical protein